MVRYFSLHAVEALVHPLLSLCLVNMSEEKRRERKGTRAPSPSLDSTVRTETPNDGDNCINCWKLGQLSRAHSFRSSPHGD